MKKWLLDAAIIVGFLAVLALAAHLVDMYRAGEIGRMVGDLWAFTDYAESNWFGSGWRVFILLTGLGMIIKTAVKGGNER
ncbi:hypothetical protein I5421_05985 [Citrobacter braakii]|nr:hypothetical protein [Citrobacter braakii]MBJ8901142.1 hypothetical protein [Citrobacter braakii]MBJ8905797.1 hypothetical protein [Citrobacter braakii]MBJ8919347.1 hypothetical protein [Citrobacter braakii]